MTQLRLITWLNSYIWLENKWSSLGKDHMMKYTLTVGRGLAWLSSYNIEIYKTCADASACNHTSLTVLQVERWNLGTGCDSSSALCPPASGLGCDEGWQRLSQRRTLHWSGGCIVSESHSLCALFVPLTMQLCHKVTKWVSTVTGVLIVVTNLTGAAPPWVLNTRRA